VTNTRPSALALLGLVVLSACSGGEGGDAGDESESTLSGAVQVDGSSTVAPISEAMAEEFQLVHSGVRVTVGIAGTGGGFQRFCSGETDISDASRPISDEEKQNCAIAEIEYLELPVAWDGLSVVVNPENDFADCLTVEELRRIWQPNSRVTTWRDVRSEFPAQPIKLYGAGTDSGTFDYFTEVIVGETGASRTDYQASEDDNVLVQGVAGDPYALGYFGHAYATQNADKVKSIGVDNGAGCVLPTDETIGDKSYAPLSRELFIYVARGALSRPAVDEFVRFYMENAAALVPSTGYLALDAAEYQANLQALQAGPGPDGASDEPADSAGPVR
jgi:phosphate transport system substrate-binding protein